MEHDYRAQNAIEIEKQDTTFLKNAAELIGFLTESGSVVHTTGRILTQGTIGNPQLTYFREIASHFTPSVKEKALAPTRDGMPRIQLYFNNRPLARWIGNLQRGQWLEEFQRNHCWIDENPEFFTSFLTGFLPGKTVYRSRTSKIVIETPSPEIAEYISNKMYQIGLNLEESKEKDIVICDPQSVIKFGNTFNHRLNIPQLQTVMENQKVARTSSVDLFREWLRLFSLMDKAPNETEINTLKKAQQTPYSNSQYSDRFGFGKYSVARRRLESMREIKDTMEQTLNPYTLTDSEINLFLKLLNHPLHTPQNLRYVYTTYSAKVLKDYYKFKLSIEQNLSKIGVGDPRMEVYFAANNAHDNLLKSDSFENMYEHAKKLKEQLKDIRTIKSASQQFIFLRDTFDMSELQNSVSFVKRLSTLIKLTNGDRKKAEILLAYSYFRIDMYSMEELAALFKTDVPRMRDIIDFTIFNYEEEYEQAFQTMRSQRIDDEELESFVEDLIDKRYSINEMTLWLGESGRRVTRAYQSVMRKKRLSISQS
jgi:hypothetical protein